MKVKEVKEITIDIKLNGMEESMKKVKKLIQSLKKAKKLDDELEKYFLNII